MFILLFNSKDISHQYIHTNMLIHHVNQTVLLCLTSSSNSGCSNTSWFSLLLGDGFKPNPSFLQEGQQSSRKQCSSPSPTCSLLSSSVCLGLISCLNPGYQRDPQPAVPDRASDPALRHSV